MDLIVNPRSEGVQFFKLGLTGSPRICAMIPTIITVFDPCGRTEPKSVLPLRIYAIIGERLIVLIGSDRLAIDFLAIAIWPFRRRDNQTATSLR